MGRIKSTMVKRTAEKILDKQVLYSDFGDVKKALGSNTMPSKRIRNMIAGYIARLSRRAQAKKAAA